MIVTRLPLSAIRTILMKPTPLLMVVPIALGIGFFLGRQSGGPSSPDKVETAVAKETKSAVRSSRADPFGGPSFSLSSMEDVRMLFRQQRSSVASARLTLAVESLSAKDIPALMEMAQEDFRKNPDQYDPSRNELMGALFGRWAMVDPSAALDFVHSCKQRSFKNLAAQSCFAALARADPARAVTELRSLPKGEMREGSASSVVNVLAKKDPSAACDLLASEPSSNGFSSYYAREIMMEWGKTDPTAAAARLASLPDDIAGEYAVGGLAAVWAQADPDAALAWAKTLKGDRKAAASTQVYTTLSREDAAAAWERLKSEPGHLRGKISAAILNVVADEDPKKAVAMLKGMEIPSERRIATSQMIQNFGWSETRLGFELAYQLDDPTARREALGSLMYYAAWGSGDLLKEQMPKLTDRERIDTANQVLDGLMKKDPKEAQDYFLALPETQRSPDDLREMMGAYSRKDAAAGLSFAMSLSNPQEQTAAVNGLFATWGREDPEAAAEALKKLPQGDGRLGALNTIAAAWAANDPTAARQWADSLSGSERVRALAAVLPSLAKDDPVAASGQLATLLNAPPDGMAKNLASSASTLAATWANDDPTAASQWAMSLPAGQSRDGGVGAISRAWSQYDAIAAAKWIGTLEAGSARDAAVKPLVTRVRQTDPATAFSWAATIEDSADRVSQLGETLKSWRGTDLAAARAALDAADLTPEDRVKLQKEIE